MKPMVPLTIRPLSPIRRNTANSATSMSSVLSSPSSPPANHRTISPLDTAAVQLDAESAQAGLAGGSSSQYKYSATVTAASPTSPTKVTSLRSNMSFGAFSLSQGPTSPLPSPSIPTTSGAESASPSATPFPFPAVLARQGSHLAERASIRSMYADSIYDCYDYDSGSEYDTQDLAGLARQESFRSSQHIVEGQQQETIVVAESTLIAPIPVVPQIPHEVVEEVVVARSIEEPASANTTAAVMTPASKIEAESVATVVVSLNNEVEQTQTQVPESAKVGSTTSGATPIAPSPDMELPVIRLRGTAAGTAGGDNRDSQALKEEHHILFEDIPKAVPYRMSMMTTVPVDPVGVAASLSVPLLAAGAIAGVSVAGGPSRPTRNPMRQSRHGSMLSIGESSDLTTTDSWMSSSVRDTRDDMSGWDIRGEHPRPETVDENESVRRISLSVDSGDEEGSERVRRPSVDSFMTSSSLASSAFQARRRSSVRSERTMSIMTDKHSLILEEEGSASSDEEDENSIAHRDLKIRIKGLECSSSSSDTESEHATGLKDGESPEGSMIRHKKQWYKERRASASKRETWGSIQSSSSSDSNTTSSSSSGSSHSNFYFNGRSPSPSPTEESAPVSAITKAF